MQARFPMNTPRKFSAHSAKLRRTFATVARVALHHSDLRQLFAIGLADIEYIGSPKPCDRS